MTARSQEGPLKLGEVFCGKYEVIDFVGRGGSGHVYKALHTFLGKHVAIKAIFRPDGLNRDAVRRAQAEAQIMNALRHPNVCEVSDAGTEEGIVYIVMEFLRGRPMRAALEEYQSLRIEEALGLCAQIAEGVHAAHLAGVIHRDLKPDNAFIQAANQVKVLDFGVAKLIDAAAWSTQKGVVHGTAYYMSPEQIHLGTLGPTSDVFALGLVLYEALIGRHPVSLVTDSPVPTFWEICRVLANVSMPRIDDVDPRIPYEVARLVERAVHRSPQKRFASMKEFARAMLECRVRWLEYARGHGIDTAERELSRPSPNRIVRAAQASGPGGDHDTLTQSRPTFFGGISSSELSPLAPGNELRSEPVAGDGDWSVPPESSDRALGAGNTERLRGPARGPGTTPDRVAALATASSTADGFERRLRRSKGRFMLWMTAGSSVFLGLAIVVTGSAVYMRTHPRGIASARPIATADLSPSAVLATSAVPNHRELALASAAPEGNGSQPAPEEPATAPLPTADEAGRNPPRHVPAPAITSPPVSGLVGTPKRSTPKTAASKQTAKDGFEEMLMRRAEEKLKAEEAREKKSQPAGTQKNQVWIE